MTMERGAPRLTTLALAGVLVLLAGCSNDGGGDGSSGASASAGSTASTGPTGPQPAEIEATVEVGADPIGIASGEVYVDSDWISSQLNLRGEMLADIQMGMAEHGDMTRATMDALIEVHAERGARALLTEVLERGIDFERVAYETAR